MSRLIVVVGPNGSGKSSIIADVLKTSDINYICPDNIYMELEYIEDTRERYILAMQECERLRYESLNNGMDFMVETVGSTIEKLSFIKYAKRLGYFIECVIITTENPVINLVRVAQRVQEGGHDVPAQKIIERYYRVMDLLSEYINLVDIGLILDNSGDRIIITGVKLNKEGVYILNNQSKKDWVIKYISSKLSVLAELNIEETKIFLGDHTEELACLKEFGLN